MTRDVGVCWSIPSLTRTAHGSRWPIHGRARESEAAFRRSVLRNAVWSLGPDVATVGTFSRWGELALPHHDLATEVADFQSVLVESLGLDDDDATIVLRR